MIGNVYYVGTDGLASYLITSPQGHILVDTVMPEATSQIKANIEKLGFKITDIKYLLNTHAHIDHTGGLAEMKAGQRRASWSRAKPTSRCSKAAIIRARRKIRRWRFRR